MRNAVPLRRNETETRVERVENKKSYLLHFLLIFLNYPLGEGKLNLIHWTLYEPNPKQLQILTILFLL